MALDNYKAEYRELQKELASEFVQSPPKALKLLLKRSKSIDSLLKKIWTDQSFDRKITLVAVGGYGREELHLHSDIDIMILIPNQSYSKYEEKISNFLTILWDVGIEIGHSTRDLSDCILAMNDLSITTNIFESRFICGSKVLFEKMYQSLQLSEWSDQSFFIAKKKEQETRHQNFSNSGYNLEPNIKESPGGIRDFQNILWISKWCLKIKKIEDLSNLGHLSHEEIKKLKSGIDFIFRIRYALHVISNRREDRLQVSYQKNVADYLGYESDNNSGLTKFMKDYFLIVRRISRINDMLLQIFETNIVNNQKLNSEFSVNYGFIEANDLQVFKKHPSTIIEIFLLLAKNSYVRGIGADTLRSIQNNLHLIDGDFSTKRQINHLFIEILQQKQGVYKTLTLMNRYGVLEKYIPEFGQICGLMQFDLFHQYTVDQHTLFVIRNIRRFFVDDYKNEFPLCSKIAKNLKKPELLLLAGLFHDIGKGRGGDHSDIGAKDVSIFCKNHQLKIEDSLKVNSLVKNHLLMSQVSQKQNIDDSDVISSFIKIINSQDLLDYLYLLTVADIRATREDLWNDWKDALLKKLYMNASNALKNDNFEQDLTSFKSRGVHEKLIHHCISYGIDPNEAAGIIETLPTEYFARYDIDDIKWHLELLIKASKGKTIIEVKESKYGVTDIFVCLDDFEGLFYRLLQVIEENNLNVVDAKIVTSKAGKVLNTISVLESKKEIMIGFEDQIRERLNPNSNLPLRKRSNKMDNYPKDWTNLTFSEYKKWDLTKLELNTIDRKGILSNIAYIFYKNKVSLINARISTIGERVEDVFYICERDKSLLSIERRISLEKALKDYL